VTLRRSLFLSFAQRYAGLLIQFGATMVLSRLLTPHEIGVFSLCAVTVGLAHTLRDFGVGEYLVQEKALTRDRLRSAFALTLAIAWALALALWVVAAPLAELYDEPGLADVLPILALNFILLPLGSPAFALLTRDMRFDAIFVIQTVAGAVQAALAIGLAWAGFSYLSLAWASLVSTACMVLLTGWYRPRDTWVLPSLKEWRHVGRFGTMACAANLLDDAHRNAHEFILGYNLGFRAVGLYSRANGLVEAFHNAFTAAILRVVLPSFAAAHHTGEPLGQRYGQALGYFASFAWPFFAVAALLAAPMLAVLFGPQWGEAVVPMQILAIAAMLHASCAFAPQVLTAAGRIHLRLQVQALVFPVQMSLVFLASLQGLAWVALAMGATGVLVLLLYQRALGRAIGFSGGDLVRACRSPFELTLGAAVLPLVLVAFRDALALPMLVELLAGGLGALLGWLAVLGLRRPPLAVEVGRTLGMLRKAR
jgi:O-antigen/teichoic acid export membrane protein